MRHAGLLQQIAGRGPRLGRSRAREHRAQGLATGEDGSRELQHAVLLEELGERRAVLIIDVAHRPLDDLPDLELVDPAIDGRHVASDREPPLRGTSRNATPRSSVCSRGSRSMPARRVPMTRSRRRRAARSTSGWAGSRRDSAAATTLVGSSGPGAACAPNSCATRLRSTIPWPLIEPPPASSVTSSDVQPSSAPRDHTPRSKPSTSLRSRRISAGGANWSRNLAVVSRKNSRSGSRSKRTVKHRPCGHPSISEQTGKKSPRGGTPVVRRDDASHQQHRHRLEDRRSTIHDGRDPPPPPIGSGRYATPLNAGGERGVAPIDEDRTGNRTHGLRRRVAARPNRARVTTGAIRPSSCFRPSMDASGASHVDGSSLGTEVRRTRGARDAARRHRDAGRQHHRGG